MTKPLISVRNPDEARRVIDLPIGILDLKEPSSGALGFVGADIAAQVARMAAEKRGDMAVSATTGDLETDELQTLAERVAALDAAGVDYVKVGFFSHDDFAHIPALLKDGRTRAKLIGVLFADRLKDFEGPCRLLHKAGFAGVMLDTADKTVGSVVNLLSLERLARFTDLARAQGLLCGIAGSLSDADIPALLPCRADYLGFRSACCTHGRDGAIVPSKVQALMRRFADAAADEAAKPLRRGARARAS